MSIATGLVTAPYSAAWCTRYETFALQISFLLGRQLTLGQEPPIQRRSTTTVDWPDDARCHARCLPPAPLPRITFANDSASGMLSSHPARPGSHATLPLHAGSEHRPNRVRESVKGIHRQPQEQK